MVSRRIEEAISREAIDGACLLCREDTVEWFRRNARVVRKRYTSEFHLAVCQSKQFQTLYFGQRPNILRIYDKGGERRVEYKRLIRTWNTRGSIPTFEQRYGHKKKEIVTRIERQYGGGRVPKAIGTLGLLQKNAAELDPFAPLKFLPVAICEESVGQLFGDAYVRAQGVLRLVERYGYHEAKRLLDQKTCRNTHRLLAHLAKSMSSDCALKTPDLFAIYVESINRQLSG